MEHVLTAIAPQHLQADLDGDLPIRLLNDRILVLPEPEPEQHGRVLVPETARRPGVLGTDRFLRYGTVVKTGPGDRCGVPQRKADETPRGGLTWSKVRVCIGKECPRCHGTGFLPMSAKVGDRILYDNSSQYWRHGVETYVILHEQQHVLAVIASERIQ